MIDNLLHSIRFRSSAYYRPELRAPWGSSIDVRGPTFYIISHGKCWIEVNGVAKLVQLSAGDFVVLPRSDSHIVRDFPTTPVVDYFDFLKGRAPDKQGAFSAGGEGSVARLVCGGMQSENGATDPLLAVLPPLIHFKGGGEDATPGLRTTVSHIFEEMLPTIYASLLAQGGNFGLTQMSRMSDFSYQQLLWTTNWYLREETLKAATTMLVNHHHHLPLSRLLGGGTLSSSDGQRFPVAVKTANATALPRYFGYSACSSRRASVISAISSYIGLTRLKQPLRSRVCSNGNSTPNCFSVNGTICCG